MVVLAARVNTSPRPASKIDVDEGCSVRQVEHDRGALQPNEFEMTGCRPCVPSEAQRAVFVIACSWVEGTLLARLGLGYDSGPPEASIGSGSMVSEDPFQSPSPQQEAERIVD